MTHHHVTLAEISHELKTIQRRLERGLRTAHSHYSQKDLIMAALDALKALEPRLDNAIATAGTDVSTAVAAATKPLNDQIAELEAAAVQTESDTQAVADSLTGKVGALETAVGVAPAAPAE